ncbi:DUF2642 domain-containing protein [Paenibacillus guangzhouensis]|uniref:DUF2642 domain-containing protein n=1 Tax=Paenibacillus guangzhouensis TaxID=1473112 RepID=UPI0012670182|nr:DUF2642 domain-containing protein [Paenibacillus guangzhouensis]
MSELQKFVGKKVQLLISELSTPLRGVLVDYGSDVLVIQRNNQHLYIPLIHLQNMLMPLSTTDDNAVQAEAPLLDHHKERISYRKILMLAKGAFSEVYITGSQSLHGYVTNIMNDFFVFFSPAFHTILIPLQHLKYLIPYNSNETPYRLTVDKFPLQPTNMAMARTFEQQLKKFEGSFVVFDLGENHNKIGQLLSVDEGFIELIQANGESNLLLVDHVKCVHLPYL